MARDVFPRRIRLWERRFLQRWAIWTMIAHIITYPKRHAAMIQLAADMQQLEIGVLTGQVRGEELKRRTQELAERYEALH